MLSQTPRYTSPRLSPFVRFHAGSGISNEVELSFVSASVAALFIRFDCRREISSKRKSHRRAPTGILYHQCITRVEFIFLFSLAGVTESENDLAFFNDAVPTSGMVKIVVISGRLSDRNAAGTFQICRSNLDVSQEPPPPAR